MRLSSDLQDELGKSGAVVRTPFPWWLRPFLRKGVSAITLGRRIYVAAELEDMEELMRHELVHIAQVARLGVVRFYWRYVSEYIALRRRGLPPPEAYRNISFEVEAFAAEKKSL